MKRLRPSTTILLIVSVAVSSMGGLPRPLQAEVQHATALAESEQLWDSGVAFVVRGRFAEAHEVLSQIVASNPGDENFQEVESWLARYNDQDAERRKLQAKLRERYLRKARESLDEKKWEDALAWARQALISSNEAPGFLDEPWVGQIRDEAIKLANTHREEGKWRDARDVYYDLKILYRDRAEHKQYEEHMLDCQSHAIFEAVYKPDSKWERRLRGININVVKEVLRRIEGQYVEQAELKALTLAALKRLRLLAESSSAIELFPTMQVDERRDEFIRRLEHRHRRLKGRDQLSLAKAIDTFERVMAINKQTVDLLPELVVYEYLEGMLGGLDQFTSMIWPADLSEFEKHTQGHFTGVGIQIGMEDNQLTVISPLEDTPAFRAGIQAGDKITHIDGTSSEGITLNGAVQRITGPIGTKVVLTIYRPSTDASFDRDLVRDVIQIHTVKGFQRQEGLQWQYFADQDFRIAYIRITNFAENTVEELKTAISVIQQQGARGLILDLRFDPGGLLRSAIEVSAVFLPRNKLIVKTEGLHSDSFSKSTDSHGMILELPMVVLVNEQSASASEIVAGALKDHGRAVIVGQRTFGKGSVQNLIPMAGTSAHLKLTTAHYYLPSGKCIHRKKEDAGGWGVEPNIEVKLIPQEIWRVSEMRRDADVIRASEAEAEASLEAEERESKPSAPTAFKEGEVDREEPQVADGAEPEKEKEKEEEKEEEEPIILPKIDYQLETALLVLRVQLLKEEGFGLLSQVTSRGPAAEVVAN